MRALSHLLLLLLLTTALSGCDLFGDSDDGDGDRDRELSTSVFVGNQGNFSDGNGSVTTYDPESEASTARAIGDLNSIVQSVTVADGVLFVAANTGDRLYRFDARSLAAQPSIKVFSPRYVAVDGDRAYVTSLFGARGSFTGGRLNLINLAGDGVVTDSLGAGNNPEGVLITEDRVYVAVHGFGNASTVFAYDRDGRLRAEIATGCSGPRALHEDEQGDVWVVCTGALEYDGDFAVVGETPGQVLVLRGNTVAARFPLDARTATAGPGQESFYNSEDETLVVVVGGRRVLRFDTQTNQSTGELTLPDDANPIGAIALDGTRDRLYVARVPSFDVAGYVTIHASSGGAELSRFATGVAPTSIAIATRDD